MTRTVAAPLAMSVATRAAFRQVKDRFVRPPSPAWTAIDVDRLVEIRVIAVISE